MSHRDHCVYTHCGGVKEQEKVFIVPKKRIHYTILHDRATLEAQGRATEAHNLRQVLPSQRETKWPKVGNLIKSLAKYLRKM